MISTFMVANDGSTMFSPPQNADCRHFTPPVGDDLDRRPVERVVMGIRRAVGSAFLIKIFNIGPTPVNVGLGKSIATMVDAACISKIPMNTFLRSLLVLMEVTDNAQ
ncbi:MAG: hypothetical protein H6970_03690 [Gammaproteobacteria bacterium]|nr:hypothetical protein [Gammaproteobacteria bacterium]